MRPATGVIMIAAALRLPQPEPIVTVMQRDPWLTNSDRPSAAVSANGRYVAFTSFAQLVPADLNNLRDIYVLDRTDGRVTLESVTSTGQSSVHDSGHPGLSADGRFLVYETHAGLAHEEPETRHVVLRDRRAATLTVVSAVPGGGPAKGWSGTPAISSSGRFVAFASTATNLVPGPDANGLGLDVYVFDEGTGSARRISVDSRGVQPYAGFSATPTLSADGRFVAFVSSAGLDTRAMLDPADDSRERRPFPQVYVRDSELSTTRLVSVGPTGRPADGPTWAPAISGDGRYVVFVSAATNLAPGDRNASADVFVTDLHTGTTELVSGSIRGGTANAPSGGPAISSNGRFITFHSEASDLVCTQRCPAQDDDINLLRDVFLLDRRTRARVRLSADATGGWMEASSGPSIDAEGTVIVFSSCRPVDAYDRRNDFDLFVRRIVSNPASLR